MKAAGKTTKKQHDATAIIAHQKALSDALFLSIGEGAIATNRDGNISRINRAALKMLGFREEEVVDKWYPTTIIVTDSTGRIIPTIERPITKSFLSGETVSEHIYFRKKDGTLLPVAVNVSPVLLDSKPVGSIE